jgi:agmatinase
MKEAMEVASDGTDFVYVSVDIDIITGSESPGTGLSEPRGITGRQFLTAMGMLSGWDKLGAIDFCEVAPEWDPGMLTVMLATSGMLSILSPYLYDTVEFQG